MSTGLPGLRPVLPEEEELPGCSTAELSNPSPLADGEGLHLEGKREDEWT